MTLNIIKAKFCEGKRSAWTDEQWQWDYGQILLFEGLELPVAYEVHFSNVGIGGTSTTQIGDAEGVTIPDTYFTTGETIYAWVYLHQGEDDGETEYSVVIPIKKRPKPSNTTPTPVQQDVITETIAALQEAVEESETNVTHYPKIESGTWWVWDATENEWVDTEVEAQGPQGNPGQDGSPGQPGADGQDGFSPEIAISSITGGHRLTITTAEGTETVDVMDGEDGRSITGAVLNSDYTLTISFSSGDPYTTPSIRGAQGQPGQNGTNGTDGVSPSVTVTPITGGHTISITDAQGTDTFNVMDGEQGEQGPTGPAGGFMDVETVSGTTPSITAEDNTMYMCGELSTLTINSPVSGTFVVEFTSGTTATVLTASNVVWVEWFDPDDLEASRIYRLLISNRKGTVVSWPA